MMRLLHRWPGLIAAALLVVIALSGAALSIFPALDSWKSPSAGKMSVATLAGNIAAAHPGLIEIDRTASGQITASYTEGGQYVSGVVDPATGSVIAAARPNGVVLWLTELHRSLFMGDWGSYIAAATALFLLTLCISGLFMMARRAGGWRYLFARPRGMGDGYLHTSIARFAVFGLAFSSVTALWMTLSTFGFIPNDAAFPAFPASVSGQTGIAPAAIVSLENTPVGDLQSLVFPRTGDPTDVFTLTTDDGMGYIDQGTGAMLSWADNGPWQQASSTILMLHTGQGASIVGLVLGLSALGVPLMGLTGIRLWLTGRKRQSGANAAHEADTIVLVGSEGGSTWGFAATLQNTLQAAGLKVHVAAMNAFAPQRWPKAERLILLAATYGDGDAPDTAKTFLEKLGSYTDEAKIPVALVGFGDRSFPHFCGYAARVHKALKIRNWPAFVAPHSVDRQSQQDFARWGRALATSLGMDFELNHQPEPPATSTLSVISRRDFGREVQAPASLIRLALPKRGLWQRMNGTGFAKFEAGDLIGVLPEGSDLPRFYSLASSSRDGFVEICVRRQNGGLCSGQLTALEPGETVQAFVRPNPAFRPGRGRAPVLLIGAGSGVAPLAGFVRTNRSLRPMHVYVGARHPQSDAFYAEEFAGWQRDGKLASLTEAYSRGAEPTYVQDALLKDGPRVAALIRDGGQVLVCGGRDMARGVAAALSEILRPHGLSLASLKKDGRYGEDIF
ncbi:N-acetylglucosamine transferase [Martelella alba]|uniref:NADPH--hemoprotein reductase n=1 Tax=Martelella alba TaxID=2590451 RepID=A0A506UJ80_9HYPH|nr:PepSY domain-containing protein [Martelella alba]TPW33370.1 N-acetylglucosamine transferase [Martelella alba]